jgi:hypothetical protein
MVIVFSFASCSNDTSSDGETTAIEGTWTKTILGTVQDVSINGNNWSLKNDEINHARGTFTITDPNATTGNASFTVKEMWNGSGWYTITNQTVSADFVMESQKTTITFSNIVGGSWFNSLEGTWTKR